MGSNDVDVDLTDELDTYSALQNSDKSKKKQGKRGNKKTENTAGSEKIIRRNTKNAEKERKRELTKAMKAVAKATNPTECIKYMAVELDTDLTYSQYGTIIKETLKKNDISCNSKSQIFPKLVTWSRNVETTDETLLQAFKLDKDYFAIILNKIEFNDYSSKDTLTAFIENIFTLTSCKHLTVAVVGLQKPQPAQEPAVIEVQILRNCYFRFLGKDEDLGELIMELTKSIAQIPYKHKKEEKHKLNSEYFNDSNKDTVKIDSNGNGLGRLWHQMLTMFPLARLETAEAITAKYPTPLSLFQAYETYPSNKQDLLQDLPIRRAQGPCVSSRKLGPELSKKCFNFFCSTDNEFL